MGRCLLKGHEGCKLYKVSCPELDFLVDFAKTLQWLFGARMMGGGFGGASIHLIPEHLKLNYSMELKNSFSNRFGYKPEVFEVKFENGIQFI